ncbi:hypothetical protein GJ698_02365 [Pseudoduganella sp. FT26W]|uniref:Uncharacterized protein n=1 Tax=Duganella aquatilis TaxID=2666082 RepID=A0A844D7W5_9BURK|nr:hypothetical protein [Duganella aquatilis]MRW82934.1 hypothetical protein [Duganella aquatilis]
MKRVAYIAAVAMLATLAAGIAAYANYDEWFILPKARKLVADKLNDPLSAQFRNDRLIAENWHCGEVNGKNAMGGYVGFRRFISGRINKEVYLERTGMVGEETTAEVLLLADKVIARMKAQNEMKARDPDFKYPNESDADRYDRARGEVFEDHWKAICEAKSIS